MQDTNQQENKREKSAATALLVHWIPRGPTSRFLQHVVTIRM